MLMRQRDFNKRAWLEILPRRCVKRTRSKKEAASTAIDVPAFISTSTDLPSTQEWWELCLPYHNQHTVGDQASYTPATRYAWGRSPSVRANDQRHAGRGAGLVHLLEPLHGLIGLALFNSFTTVFYIVEKIARRLEPSFTKHCHTCNKASPPCTSPRQRATATTTIETKSISSILPIYHILYIFYFHHQ